MHGGSAAERTAFVKEAFLPLEGFPHNALHLDAMQIEVNRPFAVLHKAMFGGARLIEEEVAFQDLETFFSGYHHERLWHTEIIRRTSDWGGADRVDYLNDLDLPWYIWLDGVDHFRAKSRSAGLTKIFNLVNGAELTVTVILTGSIAWKSGLKRRVAALMGETEVCLEPQQHSAD